MNENAIAHEYLLGRRVTRLCHFTKIRSLTHILMNEDGILATEFIQDGIKQQNDMERLDNAKDYVSCSLQYPNCWYWDKAKKSDADVIFKEWVVLTIDLDILKCSSFKFSPCNAATGSGTYIREDVRNISDIFGEPTIKIKNREPDMLECCPTDDQAEIIVYKNIPVRYINGIIVGNKEGANLVAAILKTVDRIIPIYVSEDVCNKEWSRMVRRGMRPPEIEYPY